MLTDRVYLSARSADVILSEIRSTRLKVEALQAINDLLDEIILLVIQGARSFSPAKLKDSFLKLCPTPLGKESVLEAEVELRNHRDRGIPSTPTPYDDLSSARDFPVELAFELLRLKCEECTTLNEINGDFDAESKLMQQLASLKLKPTVVPAAVFYMTAIIEHICKHILNSVGRVVARDSSRTVASSHDLYIALCEDETIYPLFSSMKSYETINAQSSMMRPRRSRSITHGDLHSPGSSSPVPSHYEGRSKAETVGGRPSSEKARGTKLYKSSGHESLNGHETVASSVPHKRTQSQNSSTRSADRNEAIYDDQDSPVSQSFDDQLKSGETVKLTLTPDRLQSMEAFKHKSQRAPSLSNPPPGRGQQSPPNTAPLGVTSPRATNLNGSRNKRLPESIDEGEEPSPGFISGRSQSARVSSPRVGGNQGSEPTPRTFPKTFGDDFDEMPVKKNVRKVTKNMEDMDLDEIMNGFDDDEPAATPQKPQLAPKDATATRTSQRDLLDFLASGPPEETATTTLSRSGSIGPGSPTDFRKGGGRFRSMVSRLRNKSSTDTLPKSPIEESRPSMASSKSSVPSNGLQNYPRPPRYNTANGAGNTNGSTSGANGRGSTPPSAYQPPSAGGIDGQTSFGRIRASSTNRKAVPEYNSDFDSVDDDAEVLSEPNAVAAQEIPALRTVRSAGAGFQNQKPSSPLVKQPAILPAIPSPSMPTTTIVTERPKIVAPPTPESPIYPAISRKPIPGTAAAPLNPPPRTVTHKTSANGISERTSATPSPRTPVNKDAAAELRNLIARAETVSECRLLVDIFLSTMGQQPSALGSSVYADETKNALSNGYNYDATESAFVECLLGSS